MRGITREEVSQIDGSAAEAFGIPTLVLMENAGRSVADWLTRREGVGRRAVIVCGPGNNGGDGGVVARHLDGAGWDVTVIWLAKPSALSPLAAQQRGMLEAARIRQEFLTQAVGAWDQRLAGADWVVDAIFGTGLSREVGGVHLDAIRALNCAKTRVVAVDIPSGLDANTGAVLGEAVRADATVTFVAPKLGFLAPGAKDYLGEVEVAPIGLPRALLLEFGLDHA